MKKINNIHIDNCAFFFEEDASNIMEQYIARIKELYRDNGEELKVADVEHRIAEFCKKRVGENGIVDVALISEAIDSIGIQIETPQTSGTTEEQPTGEAKAEEPKDCSNEAWYRAMLLGNKIFRNPHDGYIGGVLAGLAAYFGISTALLRIIAIILFIIEPMTGVIYITYIILWAIFPKATSIIDYTRMRRVNTTGEREKVETEWKNNYEQTILHLAQPPAGGCLPMLLKLLFFLPLIPLAIALCIIIVTIIAMPLGFIYMFAVGGLASATLITLPFIVMGISLITAMAVILFAIIHWIFKKMSVCKPMNKWAKMILTALLIVSLLFAGVATYHIIKKYDNLNNIDEKIEEEFDNFLGGYFYDNFLANGTVTMESGQFYNKYPVKTGDKKVLAAIWDKELQNCDIPFIVEAIENDRGEYNVYFYRHEGRIEEIEYRIVNKEYDARYTVNTDKLHGYSYFIWDGAKNTLYSDEIYNIPEGTRSSTFEKRTDAVNIDAVSHDDVFNFGNAGEKGLIPLSIFFYANQRVPSLLVGGDTNHAGIEIAPSSTYKHLEGVRLTQKATTIDNNGQKDTTQIYTNINIDEDKLNKAIDDVVTLGKRADSIIKDAHDIVSIKAIEK